MSVSNSNSVMKIEYDDEKALMSAKGIFSFSVYTSENVFDNGIKITSLFSVENFKHQSFIYFMGIANYLKMLEDDKWNGWKVVIHTDFPTILGNPLAFEKLKKMGAIIGLTRLDDKYSDSKFKAVFRLNRFYPLFINDLDVPVFVRDADTIFESGMANILMKENPEYTEIKVTSNNFILPEFVTKLSNWEQLYYNKVKKFNNKVIFSYDDGYAIPVNDNNDINKLNWLGYRKPNSMNKKYLQSHYYNKARFLAGILSKMGKSLPEYLWFKSMPEYLDKVISKLSTATNRAQIDKIRSIDESYLTNVIYKWCKENNRVEFFLMNYVQAGRIFSLAKEHFKNKYPNAYNKTTKNLNRNKLHKLISEKENSNNKTKNKKLSNLFPPGNGMIRNEPRKWHILASILTLNNPRVQLTNNAFINPLNYKNNTSKKPNTIPNYFFGGTKKHKHIHKRKTYKNRK